MRQIKKFIFVLSIVILLSYLFGCTITDKTPSLNESEKGTIQKSIIKDKINVSEKDTGQSTSPLSDKEQPKSSLTGCGGWRCISSFVKAYQYENCSFGKSEKCLTSCVNNTCASAKTCTSGFKCFSKSETGYQKEDCSWSNYQKCQFGCSSGGCNPMPEGYNATNATNASAGSEVQETNAAAPSPQEPAVTVYSLKYGEEHQLDGKTFRIYNLESDRVILLAGSVKSNWLKIGDEFIIGNSKIKIQDISYQPYVGGAQTVDYVVK